MLRFSIFFSLFFTYVPHPDLSAPGPTRGRTGPIMRNHDRPRVPLRHIEFIPSLRFIPYTEFIPSLRFVPYIKFIPSLQYVPNLTSL